MNSRNNHTKTQAIEPMQKGILIFLIAGSIILSGCGHLRHASGNPKSVNLIKNKKDEKDLIHLIQDAENRYYNITKTPKTGIPAPNLTINPAATKEVYREIYGSKMLELIDLKYDNFRASLVGMRKGFDASSDILAVTLDSGAALFKPDSTKSILAALSGLTTSSKTSINKTYFYEQTLPLLISQMDANRETVLQNIYAGLKTDVTTYPLHQLRHDLTRYLHAGTVDGAITASLQQATQQKKNAQEGIQKQLEDEIKDSKSRIQQAQKLVATQEGFTKLSNAIAIWWAALSKGDQDNQIYPLYLNLNAIGVPDAVITFYNPPVAPAPLGTANANQFLPFLAALTFDANDPTSRQILVKIAMNAHDLTIPSIDQP